jgi:hypothetical protein
LFPKKVEVVVELVDGMCDVLALLLFEKQRAEGAQGQEWKARQMMKVEGEASLAWQMLPLRRWEYYWIC